MIHMYTYYIYIWLYVYIYIYDYVYIYIYMVNFIIYIYMSGWWFETWLLCFPSYRECHHPIWLSHVSEGGESTNQMCIHGVFFSYAMMILYLSCMGMSSESRSEWPVPTEIRYHIYNGCRFISPYLLLKPELTSFHQMFVLVYLIKSIFIFVKSH